MKNREQNLNGDLDKNNREDEFFTIRHSKAEYKMNKAIVTSDNPESKFDPKKQDFLSDLTPKGKELAQQEAEKFFNELDPEKDAIFFTTSDLVRAIETAKIYKDEAKKRGFEIIKPENVRDDLVEEIGDGEIRKLDNLSLNIDNMLIEYLFHPKKNYLEEVVKNKDNVSEETKKKWKQARQIIEADNKGTWGKNYYQHSEEIKKIFPEIKTAEEMYDRNFKNTIKLMRFAQKKINKENYQKNIKVLGFGHENLFIHFLGKNFKEGSIDNCEVIGFKINNDNIQVNAKGENKNIEMDN